MNNEERLSTRDLANATLAATGGAIPVASPAPDSLREPAAAMFPGDETAGYRTRWDGIQTGFVDEPRKAVEEADALVAQVIKRLTEVFAEERTRLEHHWDRGEQVSTEDLRQALRTYRSFFERLLAV
jgi:hypothetical protein